MQVEVNNLFDEEKFWYNLLNAKYANITTHSESYKLTNIYVRDDESYINELVYGLEYTYFPIGEFEYTFTQDDNEAETLNLNNGISYVPKFNVIYVNTYAINAALEERSISAYIKEGNISCTTDG